LSAASGNHRVGKLGNPQRRIEETEPANSKILEVMRG
jgi:hypothetical protein